jgi:hypothetical protein
MRKTATPDPLPRADRAAVTAAALVGGLLIAQLVAGRAVRDALFLSAYSVSSLPGMILVSALLSLWGAVGFASALARRPPAAVLTAALALQALLLAGEWGLAAGRPRLVAAALYIQVALLGPGLVSAFWSLVSERFDPHTARRVMGRIGTGASVGGVVGGVLAWAGARVLPVPALLPGLAATSLLALGALRRLQPAGVPEDARDGPAAGVGAGLRAIREFPYLRQLASLVAVGALADVLLDYLLKAGAARAFADGSELARFFSVFYAGVALLTLVLQAAATRPSLERMGLSGTVSLQPAGVALASAAGLLSPSLAGAVVARGLGGALRDSLFRSGYELFYAPLPPSQKRRTKALVDIAADKLGALLGAGVVMALAAQPFFSDRWLWLLALLAMVASVLLARRLHHGYVRALEQSLRSGLVALEPDEVADSTTRLTLSRTALDRDSLLAEIRALHGETRPEGAPASGDTFGELAEGLRSGQPERIRGALATMGSPDPGLAHLVVALLARDDVFPDVLRSLRRVAPRMTGQLVDALVDSHQPSRVRRRIPRVLKASPTPRAVEGLLLGLSDTDFAVRRACGAVLAWMRDRHAGLAVPAPAVYAAVVRELEAPATDPEAQLDHVFALLSAAGEAEPLRATRWALRGQDQHLRGTALEYLEQVLPDAVRQPLLRRLGAAWTPPARPRALDEVEEELRRSAVSLPRGPATRRRGP